MRNYILIVIGICLSLLMILFSANIFESIFYDREFSNEMYNLGLYFEIALLDVITAWLGAFIFYYLINSVRFSRWFHWLLTMLITALFSVATCYYHSENVFISDAMDFSRQLFIFSFINAIVECVLFIVASFSMRSWSSNCRYTPIPE